MAAIAHVVEHQLLLYRRSWRGSVISSFLSPVLFLASIGLGLGGFVDANRTALGVPYIAFLAPGLLAATAMQAAASEATFPVMSGIMWSRSFVAMTVTPIGSRQVVLGLLAYIGLRLALVASIFTLVVVAFGAAASPAIVLAIPAAILTGLAFAAPIAAFTATQRDTQWFNALFRFGITPLFLFSGTFFPIEGLPGLLQPIAWLTPLYHGVALARALSLGTAVDQPVAAIAHVVYLVTLTALGGHVAAQQFRRRLEN